MKLIKGNEYFGFELLDIDEISDINSVGYTFKHIKSGARLMYVKNDDDNKVFFISFKTPPENNCGTAHILEHSVLCGSKKYPVKDPFNELAKGSLNTYLNALTYSDKTMYPIASRNDKDFCNLMDVYLDAVLNPKIFEKKEIFMQEGWHYEMDNKDSLLSIKGVVYNEMKGALSDPDRILSNCISKSLFPSSIYRFESGGDPDYIPELTYEMFLDFYNKYYHTSNSYIYLYGNLDIYDRLKYLDSEYLSNYSDKKINSDISFEKKFSQPSYYEETYPVPIEDSVDKGEYIALSSVVGKSTDMEMALAFDILNYILLGSNGSPLKQAITKLGMCEDAEGWFDSSAYEMVYSIVAKKADKNKIQIFKDTVINTLENLVKNGIDSRLIESSLNVWEFLMREEDYGFRPKGLVYGMKMMKGWLHGKNPSECLLIWKHFNRIKEQSLKGYFENIIKDYLINNVHSSFVDISPECGKQSGLDKKNKEKLAQIKNSMTEEEINKIISDTKALNEYQSTAENVEDLKSIPLLSIDEISKKADIINNKEINEFGCPILFTPLNTNNITYTQIIFDTKCVPCNLIPYIGLLSDILGKIDTKKFNYNELPTEINMYTGGIYLYCDAYLTKNGYEPKLIIKGKSLTKHIDKMFDIFKEIIFNSCFDNYDNLKSIVKEVKLRNENLINNNGHVTAIRRSLSNLSEETKYKELTGGIDYYLFLCEVEKELSNNYEKVINDIQTVIKIIFNKVKVLGVVAGDEDSLVHFGKAFKEIYDKLNGNIYKNTILNYKQDLSEAFTTAGKVQYVAKAGNFKDYGYKYSGKMNVLKIIVDLEYLWNKVRVKGGAYGSGCGMFRNGNIYAYSYRDPNIIETLNNFNDIHKLLENFNASERDMTKYILGAVNSIDRPKSNSEKADLSFRRYICNITYDIQQIERNELLGTRLEDIREYSNMFKKVMSIGNICVIGNEYKISESKDIFDSIKPLI